MSSRFSHFKQNCCTETRLGTCSVDVCGEPGILCSLEIKEYVQYIIARGQLVLLSSHKTDDISLCSVNNFHIIVSNIRGRCM